MVECKVVKELQFDENGKQVGWICKVANDDLLQAERNYYNDLILKKAQKENPDLFWKAVQRGRQLLEKETAPPIQFHAASINNATTTNNNNDNALRMYSLMKKIVGSSDNDYDYYQNNNNNLEEEKEDNPRFHKASVDSSSNNNNNNNNDFLKHYELVKMIASCASPFEM